MEAKNTPILGQFRADFQIGFLTGSACGGLAAFPKPCQAQTTARDSENRGLPQFLLARCAVPVLTPSCFPMAAKDRPVARNARAPSQCQQQRQDGLGACLWLAQPAMTVRSLILTRSCLASVARIPTMASLNSPQESRYCSV